jgi:hypothetical protein
VVYQGISTASMVAERDQTTEGLQTGCCIYGNFSQSIGECYGVFPRKIAELKAPLRIRSKKEKGL